MNPEQCDAQADKDWSLPSTKAEPTHTAGRMAQNGDRVESEDDHGVVNDGWIVAECKGPDASWNARRLVVCWNACEGIRTEGLEAEPEKKLVKYLYDRKANYLVASLEIGKQMRQRAELLAALEYMVANIGQPECIETREGYANARAAIAKARGQA